MAVGADIQNQKRRPPIEGLPPKGMSREVAAWYVDVSPTTFDKMVADGRMPKPKKPHGNRKSWDRNLLERYYEALPDEDDEATQDEWAASL